MPIRSITTGKLQHTYILIQEQYKFITDFPIIIENALPPVDLSLSASTMKTWPAIYINFHGIIFWPIFNLKFSFYIHFVVTVPKRSNPGIH